MNQNFFLKCDTCETVYRVRMQAGFFHSVPFTYQCPVCKVVSKGEVELPISKAPKIFLTNLRNSTETDNQDDKYVIQLSTELYTDKMMRSKGGIAHSIKNMSPFMQYVSDGKNFEAQQIADLSKKIIECISNNFNDYTAIWNLYSKNSNKYLYTRLKELNLFNSKVKYYKFEKMKDCEKISFMPHLVFDPIMEEMYLIEKRNTLKNSIIRLRKKNFQELKKLKPYIERDISMSLNKIVQVNESFFDYYNYILPVIVNECVGAYTIKTIKERWGIAQTDFEYLKKFYAENYENLKDMIITLVLIQNLVIRGSIYKFHSKFYRDFEKPFKNKDYVEDFNRVITKVANRMKVVFYDNNTIIDRALLEKVFDNEVRNSINHQDYEYDYNSQKITFVSNTKQKDIFLIEFADMLFTGNVLAIILWEMYMSLMDIFNFKSQDSGFD